MKMTLGELYHRHKGRCFYCSAALVLDDPTSSRAATRDHKTPRSRGGTNHPRNLVLACRSCNMEKGAMDHIEYRAMIAAGGVG